ncbi:MAG: ATPase, T2SS/T4P/T4SS family [Deltaproteobacteria bacterium]
MAKRIVIFSTKGGVGKTFIATNLAVSLAKDQGRRVLLIDLDLQVVADMARMLNLKPRSSIADLCDRLQMQDPEHIDKSDYVTPTNFGIHFLPAAMGPRQVNQVDPGKIKSIFSLFDNDYDFIIVDAGKGFSESLINALNQANLILLTVTPDILSVYQTKWVLDTLPSLHFPLKMVKIILNRAESISAISLQDVNLALPSGILANIPSEGKAVIQALNNGTPVVIDSPRSKVSLAIKKLSQQIIELEYSLIEHKEIDESRLKELTAKDGSDFWEKVGMADVLSRQKPEEETVDEILNCKRRIHRRLIDELKLEKMEIRAFTDPKRIEELKVRAEKLVTNLLLEELGSFISSSEIRKKLIREILDEALGFGPLEDLLADPSITDIMVNNKDQIYIERDGRIELTSKKFLSNEQVKIIIERIIAPIGRRIDESVPMVDARLPDGSRINAIIPPLSLTGPSLTIRKFRKERFTVDELIQFRTLTSQMVEFLKACVLSRKNIVVSGGTGSGKTTILNFLSTFIPNTERIVTIEDAAELKLDQEHWIRLESRQANIEGKGAVAIRDLFRNTLRMRPDRIIIGECRSSETLDMLQAMNTGHDGSLTTVHANSTQDVMVRLDSMILMAGLELPVRAIREMVSSSIDLIIHTMRLSDGSRKITQISELLGMKEDGSVDLRDIFIFKQIGLDSKGKVTGDFHATGYVPSFLEQIRAKGINLPESVFKKS